MVDMGAISGGLAALKAARDIAEGLINLRDTAKFQGAVVELQGKILAAQSDQFALLERARELEAKLARLEAWEAEKRRYQLKDFGGSTFAYELRPEAADGEPPHRICPNCYQKGHKSILQFQFQVFGQDRYICPGCETEFAFGQRQAARINYPPSS
ncbi:MAG TPA: hypothetical protein VEO53_16700 [Candidatus Binatia bacterium]|nr:hypothetical protein [Candidatus Binatia bacterium]